MLLLKNGKILDEKGELITTDILVRDGEITEISADIQDSNAKIIELNGKLIAPGLIDVHVHLREPGDEHKETIATGTAAAARGGYTLIAAMPNIKRVVDKRSILDEVLQIIKDDAIVRVIPYGTISAYHEGFYLSGFSELAEDVIGFSDDGKGIKLAEVMFHAMLKADEFNRPIVAHCEDESLIFGGSFHDSYYKDLIYRKGFTSVSESVHVARDAVLAKVTGARYHVCHVSTKESVSIIRLAKAEGIKITAEVTPHHLLLTDQDISTENITNFKMNPPLRSEEDRQALIEGVVDGTIDMIATDHAPHSVEEKSLPVDKAPFGIVGLETAFPLMYTNFVKNGDWSLSFLLDRMSAIPAKVFELPYGRLEVGRAADISVFDLDSEYEIDVNAFASKGKNSPFAGHKVSAETFMTIVGGEVVYQLS